MSNSVEYIDTDFAADPVVHTKFFGRFDAGIDPDGTPLPDLYVDPSAILNARGPAPFIPSHGWSHGDRALPRLAAIYHPWADRFDVISFVIREVVSPTEIEIRLFDIFTLGPEGFDYVVESKGITLDLIMNFATNQYDEGRAFLKLCALDQGQDIDPIMDWAWAMIRGAAKLDKPDGLVN